MGWDPSMAPGCRDGPRLGSWESFKSILVDSCHKNATHFSTGKNQQKVRCRIPIYSHIQMFFHPFFPQLMESRDSPQFQEAARWPCGRMAPARGVSGPSCGRVPPAPCWPCWPREAPGGAAGGTAGAGTGGWNSADFRDGSAKIWYQLWYKWL